MYTVFAGLMIYLIIVLADPFRAGIGVDPTTFEQMIEIMQSRMR